MKKIAKGVALYRKFSVFELSGAVQSETTRSETEVKGDIHGGGGVPGRIVAGIRASRVRAALARASEAAAVERV